MATYGQYCPVAQALDLLGDRWTLLIIRDMLTGTQHFNDLHRGLPGLSRGLLSKRLQHLQDVGIVKKVQTEDARQSTAYYLTEAGKDLQDIITAFLFWGTKWSFGEPTIEQLDPLLLLWWMHDRVHYEQLPEERVVIQFDFYNPKTDDYWLVLKPDKVDICITHPGFDVNVMVTADLRAFFQVWLGRIAYEDALDTQKVRLDGLPKLTRGFPTWFMWSAAAEVVASVHRPT